MLQRVVAVLICVMIGTSLAHSDWLSELDVSWELEKNGKQLFSVRFTPDKTQHYEKLTFECVYRQEFPWENFRGEKYTKIHEPVSFTYRYPDLDFVAELDVYCHFRAPIDREILDRTHGHKVFNPDHPVVIDRLKISAFSEGRKLWICEVPAKCSLKGAELRKRMQTPKPETGRSSP